MTERIRYHLDENVNSAIAQALRRYGIDVTTTVDADLMTASDPAQLGYAAHVDRVIVTHDRDFLAMANSGEAHAGIAYCHSKSRTVGEIVAALKLIYECLTPDKMQNRIEYL
jgi:predicted nuclease of predicted toxin-antitoxin system